MRFARRFVPVQHARRVGHVLDADDAPARRVAQQAAADVEARIGEHGLARERGVLQVDAHERFAAVDGRERIEEARIGVEAERPERLAARLGGIGAVVARERAPGAGLRRAGRGGRPDHHAPRGARDAHRQAHLALRVGEPMVDAAEVVLHPLRAAGAHVEAVHVGLALRGAVVGDEHLLGFAGQQADDAVLELRHVPRPVGAGAP